jgi:hypothetical protein
VGEEKREAYKHLADELEAVLEQMRFLNQPDRSERSRHLSLAITDVESSQNWIHRALLEDDAK